MKTGFIGLGIMGSRMAANLLRAGHALTVWNRTVRKLHPLVELGAGAAESPADAAAGAEVLVTMLAEPAAVRETALGERGFLDRLERGAVWVDCSTVNPSFSRDMAAEASRRGIRFIDAPVSGTKGPAEKGTLTVFAGGDADDIERVRPILEAIGNRVIPAGGTGMGSSLKMVVNLMLAHGIAAYAEALSLGERLGVPRLELQNFLLGEKVSPPFLAGKRDLIEQGDYEAHFPLRLMRKDLRLAMESAGELGIALPSTAAVGELFAMANLKGFGELDFSAVCRFVAESAD